MPRLLFVVAPKGFRDEEYFVPKQILEGKGYEIDTASLRRGAVMGAGGGETQANVLVSEVKPEDYAGVVFVGGPGMVDLVNEPAFVDLAKRFYEANKLVAAICVAPGILANAGLLKSVSATCWEGVADLLATKGVVLKPKSVVWAGRIVTASGPLASQEFGETIAQALQA